jgi:PAS domain S-box-containing protein
MRLSGLLPELILSTRSDAIIAADRDGIIHVWNPGAERIFGYAADEALGRSLDLMIPERLRQRHWIGVTKRFDEMRALKQRLFETERASTKLP